MVRCWGGVSCLGAGGAGGAGGRLAVVGWTGLLVLDGHHQIEQLGSAAGRLVVGPNLLVLEGHHQIEQFGSTAAGRFAVVGCLVVLDGHHQPEQLGSALAAGGIGGATPVLDPSR